MRGLLVNEFPSGEGQGVGKTPLGNDSSKNCTWRVFLFYVRKFLTRFF